MKSINTSILPHSDYICDRWPLHESGIKILEKEIQTEQQDYLYSVCFQVNSDALQEIWGIINLNFYNIIIVLSTIDDEQFNLHSI